MTNGYKVSVVMVGLLVVSVGANHASDHIGLTGSGCGCSSSTALVNVNYHTEDPVVDGYNGGYWVASIESADKPVPWDEVDIIVQNPNGVFISDCSKETATISRESTGSSTKMDWWLCEKAPRSGKYDPDPVNNGTHLVRPTTNDEPALVNLVLAMENRILVLAPTINTPTKDSFVTFVGTTMIIIDTDSNGNFNTGDLVYVFRDFDNDPDTPAEVKDSSEMLFKSEGSNIAKKTLIRV